jgi:hypothetical protein
MNTQDTALVTVLENNALGLKVGQLLRGVLSDDPTKKREAIAILTQNPGNALALLGFGNDALGLTVRGASDVFEEVVGAIGDADEALELMRKHLTPDRLAELVVGRGDLPSAAALVADIDTLVAAINADMVAAKDEAEAVFCAMTWAVKLVDRDDYDEIIDRKIQDHSIRWYLVMSIWNEAGCPEGEDDGEIAYITDDVFTDLGLDPDSSRRALYRFLVNRETTQIEQNEWKEVGLRVSRVKSMLAEGPLFKVGAAAKPDELPADKAADELGL